MLVKGGRVRDEEKGMVMGGEKGRVKVWKK